MTSAELLGRDVVDLDRTDEPIEAEINKLGLEAANQCFEIVGHVVVASRQIY